MGKLRDDQDYWGASRPVLDAVQRYEKARNQLASERVDMIMGMHGDRSRQMPSDFRFIWCCGQWARFCSVGSVLNDEVDRMHRAWLKLRPHLTMIKGKVRWGNYLAPEHHIKFDEFKLHWDFHKKLQKKCVIHFTKRAIEDPDRPEFLGGPEK